MPANPAIAKKRTEATIMIKKSMLFFTGPPKVDDIITASGNTLINGCNGFEMYYVCLTVSYSESYKIPFSILPAHFEITKWSIV